jgi:Tol biopolymer transport system component
MPIRQRTARQKLTVLGQSLLTVLLLGLAALPATAAKHVLNGKIAFVSDRDGNSQIYVMNADGSAQTRLTHSLTEDLDPAWSPDGKRIAFVRNRQIHVMNADGSGITQLTTACCANAGPAWSLDGLRIAFHSDRDSRQPVSFEIYTMAPDGTNQTRLTDLTGSHFDAAWSPDSRSIAFVCQDLFGDRTRKICLMDADGAFVTPLTDNAHGQKDDDPSFSPDGLKILFTRGPFDSAATNDVMIMNADGSDPTRLHVGTPFFGPFIDATQPAFSPDGTKIAFGAGPERGGGQSIRVMDADGSNEVPITDGAVDDEHPAWQRIFPVETTGLYVPSTGNWLLRNSNTSGNADFIVNFGGQPGDLPVAGDWNGDGRTDVAVYRNGTFIRGLLVPSGSCIPCQNIPVAYPLDSIAFGQAGDLPFSGDWDGDGKDDLGVFRPGIQGTFLLRVPKLLRPCPTCLPRTTFTTKTVVLGTTGLPVAGDWDGNGKDGVGVYDPATTTFALSNDLAKPDFVFQFGQTGDLPLAGDWLGTGHDGIGVFQPSAPTMSLSSQIAGPPDIVFAFGVSEGLPVAGHWVPLPQ